MNRPQLHLPAAVNRPRDRAHPERHGTPVDHLPSTAAGSNPRHRRPQKQNPKVRVLLPKIVPEFLRLSSIHFQSMFRPWHRCSAT
jgi:hypothetical protein